MTSINAAIETLTAKRDSLVSGLNSIAEQQKNLDLLRQQVERSTKSIAADKAALVEVDNALNILLAGESA